jgi:O-antigen/teichoic acid export membrane protein
VSPEALIATREGRIARSFAALASGDAVGRVVAFLAGVWIARRLGASAFGIFSFAQAVVLYFTHLTACGVDLTGIREIASDPSRARTLAPSLLTFRMLVAAGLIAILAAAAFALLPFLDAVVLALFGATMLGHASSPKFVLMGLSRPGPVAAARVAGEALYALLVWSLVRERLDLVWVPWAQAAGDVLASLWMLVALSRAGSPMPVELDWRAAKPLLARSFPLVLNILLGLLIYNSDLLVLRHWRDTTTVGWYSASYQLISFLINMAWAYSHSLLPSLTEARADTGERRALYQTSLAQTFAVALPIAVGGALLSGGLIELVFGADYARSAAPLAILIASVPFLLHKDVAMVAMIVAGREAAILRITVIAVAFNLVGNLLVIPTWGMLGAASTTLATEVLRAVLTAAAVRREGLAPLHPSRAARSLVAACVMAGVLLALGPAPVLVLVAAGAAAYAIALFLLGGIELRRGALPALRV